ncbi:hypothetical protein QJQ45_007940 [Haematococcus lacustris]|nr:hypothetical protein QJQ45_007940 [Haematococcus lacustris]
MPVSIPKRQPKKLGALYSSCRARRMAQRAAWRGLAIRHATQKELEHLQAKSQCLGSGAFGKVYRSTTEPGMCVKVAEVTSLAQLAEHMREFSRSSACASTPLLLCPTQQWLTITRGGSCMLYMQEMHAVEGGTLHKLIKSSHKDSSSKPMWPREDTLTCTLAQLLGLARTMHRAGVVHRDLKPQNLCLLPQAHVLHCCDFGAATHLGRPFDCARPQESVFSINYAPPELLDPDGGAVMGDPSQDMFAVGAILYAMVAGPDAHPLVLDTEDDPDTVSASFSTAAAELFERMQAEGCGRLITHRGGKAVLAPYSPRWLALLQGLCEMDPAKRWTYNQALQCGVLQEQELEEWAASAELAAGQASTDQAKVAHQALARLYRALLADMQAPGKHAGARTAQVEQLVRLLQPIQLNGPSSPAGPRQPSHTKGAVSKQNAGKHSPGSRQPATRLRHGCENHPIAHMAAAASCTS